MKSIISIILGGIKTTGSAIALFVISAVIFFGIAYVAPPAFIAIGKAVDAPRCFIGMKEYCDRNYDSIREFGR